MIKNRKSFIVGIKSLKLSNNEKIFLTTHKPWGVILFSRNIKSLLQTIMAVTNDSIPSYFIFVTFLLIVSFLALSTFNGYL